jgi:uncharacterized protein
MRPWLLATLLFSAPVFAGTPFPDAPHVVATGNGEVTAAPDEATVVLSVDIHDPDAARAKQAVDRAINAVLALAPRYGAEPRDVTAADLSLSEDTDNDRDGKRTSNGFEADREIRVKLHDLDRVSPFIDAALAGGMTSIERVEVTSTQSDALAQQARAKAAADARTQAADLAKALGASLGAVYSIDSVDSERSHRYGGNLDRIEVTGSRINTGRYLQPLVRYSAQVSVVFELNR